MRGNLGRLFAVTALTLLLSACKSLTAFNPTTDRFDVDLFISGMDATKEECGALGDRVWAVSGGDSACLRVFGDLPPQGAKQMLVYLSGDLPLGDIWRLYEIYTPTALKHLMRTASEKTGIPSIMIARPGTFGSSGNHHQMNERSGREAMLINAAIDAIQAQTGVKRINLIGQSGGGHIAAYLLTKRTDLGCVVLTSAPLSIEHARKNWDRPYSIDEYAATFWDPVSHIADIKWNGNLFIYAVADRRDLIVPYDGAAAYIRAAEQSGIAAYLFDGHAKDSDAHGLRNMGMWIAGNCAKGISAFSMRRDLR